MPGRYALFAVCLLLALTSLQITRGDDAWRLVLTETSLRPSPDSEEIEGFLAVGTPVQVLEKRDDWVRIRIDGWVRAGAVEPTSAEAPAEAAEGDAAST